MGDGELFGRQHSYSVALARSLYGDVEAAALMAWLQRKTAGEGSVTVAGAAIYDETGISQVKRASRELLKRGWIALRSSRDGMHHFVVKPVPSVTLSVGPPVVVPHVPRAPSLPSAQAIIAERVDVTGIDADALLGVVLQFLGEQWHNGARTIMPTVARKRTWHEFLGAGGTPAAALKAILGMRHDDWQDRGEHCDLHHVLNNPERWLELYERKHVAGVVPRHPVVRAPPGMRLWRDGVYIDAAANPSTSDAQFLGAGYVYVVDDRAWVDPMDDPRGRVVAHRAKYGALNVTGAAAARIEAAATAAAAARDKKAREERNRDA